MNTTTADSNSTAGAASASASPVKRNALFAAGGAALVAVGLAAGLSLRSGPQPAVPVAAPVAQAVPTVPGTMVANDGAIPVLPAAQAPAAAPAPAPVAVQREQPRAPVRVAQAAAPARPAVAVCRDCGTVDEVRAVKVKGTGSGIGAVAGGVVGGALANQMGAGNGKAALTILGAVGGGFAGNEVEKHVRAETVYDVRVRMRDGSIRTVRQSTAPAVGSRVVVDNGTLRADTRND